MIMNSNGLAILLFMILCVALAYMHGMGESRVTICQVAGQMLIMKPSEIRVLAPKMDLSAYECRTLNMRNREVWDLKSAYRRAKVAR